MSVQTRTTALQNEIVRLYFTFERDGRLFNPDSQPLVEIIDTDGVTVITTISAQLEYTGVWYADYYIPANLPLGDYYDRWTFQWDAYSAVTESVQIFTVHGLDSYINFLSIGINHKISNRVIQLMKDLSNEFIYEAQHIPLYWEQAMRVQQEDQSKRIKKYYYLTLDADKYIVDADAVYFNNGQRFTVFESLVPNNSTSSSESSSSSSESISVSSSSSSTGDSNSSSSYSSTSSGSTTSSSSSSNSNSTSSESIIIPTTTTTTTTEWTYKPILTCVGTGNPSTSGTLTKISGTGPSTINFVSYEQRTSRFSTVYSLAYKNWNQDPRPIVRLNNRIIDDGWFVDYNGRIYLDGLMAPEDSVNVSYNFAYFSTEEILSFLDLGLKMMNSTPPASILYNSLNNMPREWDAPVLLYAAVTALKRLIFGLNWQEKAVIFARPDDPNAASQAIANFKDLYTDYNTTWLEVKKNAKTMKLYGMSQTVTPEYSLPGGRCLSSTTYISCKVNNEDKEALTIKELFSLFSQGKDIKVLSLKANKQLDYVSVSNIWNSGNKLTYILKTENAEIRLTAEHLVYMPKENEYRPVINITGEDYICVLKNDKLVEQKLIPKNMK